jgi:hypothetical protein
MSEQLLDKQRHNLRVSPSTASLATVALAIVSTKRQAAFPDLAGRLFPRHGRQGQGGSATALATVTMSSPSIGHGKKCN